MLRAVLIDDEMPALDLLERLIRENGRFEVAAKCTDVREALRLLRETKIDAAFLDIEMPGASGIEASEWLQEAAPGMEIVFVTAYSEYATDAFEAGAIDYLVKPLTAARLNKTINRLLHRRGESGAGQPGSAGASGRPRFYCFGRFEWTSGAGAPVKWRMTKERELAAFLVHHRNRYVRKETILEELWAGASREQAVAFLHTCVYNLRNKLNAMGLSGVLVYSDGSYRLDTGQMACDADEYEQAAADASGAGAPDIGRLERTAALYRGDYLGEEGFLWAATERERLRRLQVDLQKRIAQHYMNERQYETALGHWQAVLSINPFLEDVHAAILRTYAALGDKYTMKLHYEQFTAMLRQELDVEPEPSLTRLYLSLLSGRASG